MFYYVPSIFYYVHNYVREFCANLNQTGWFKELCLNYVFVCPELCRNYVLIMFLDGQRLGIMF